MYTDNHSQQLSLVKTSEMDRKVPVHILLPYKAILSQLHSFSACIDRCNFTTRVGWGGKTYVEDQGHDVVEYKPTLRGVELLDVHYLKLTDYVVLSEEQYRDYSYITARPGRPSA
jgi:hypothetical protein